MQHPLAVCPHHRPFCPALLILSVKGYKESGWGRELGETTNYIPGGEGCGSIALSLDVLPIPLLFPAL
jgi:hypothetical protein